MITIQHDVLVNVQNGVVIVALIVVVVVVSMIAVVVAVLMIVVVQRIVAELTHLLDEKMLYHIEHGLLKMDDVFVIV